MRASNSMLSECVMPHSATAMDAPAQVMATMRYLPKLSPIGPMMSCTEPWISE